MGEQRYPPGLLSPCRVSIVMLVPNIYGTSRIGIHGSLFVFGLSQLGSLCVCGLERHSLLGYTVYGSKNRSVKPARNEMRTIGRSQHVHVFQHCTTPPHSAHKEEGHKARGCKRLKAGHSTHTQCTHTHAWHAHARSSMHTAQHSTHSKACNGVYDTVMAGSNNETICRPY